MDSCDRNAPAERHGQNGLTGALRELAPGTHMLNALHLIIDAHSLVSVTDRAGRIIYANDRFCEVSKYARGELIGQTHRIVKSDYQPPSFFEEMWSVIKSGGTWTGDIQNKARDGSLYWAQSTISPIFDTRNRIVGYGSIRTDVTAQRRLMTKLQESEKKAYATLKSAIDVIDSSLLLVDASGHIITTNQAYSTMYPESAEEERPGNHFSRLVKKQRPELSDDGLAGFEQEVLTKDTTEQHVLADGRTVKIQRRIAPGGGFVSLHTDISDIIRQTELLEAQAATMDLLKAVAVDANESASADAAYAICLKRICKYTGWEVGHVYLPSDDGTGRSSPAGAWYFADEARFGSFKETTERTLCDPGVGLPGRVFETGKPVWLRDVTSDANFPRAEVAEKSGIVGGAAFPVTIRDRIAAVLEFFSSQPIQTNPQLEEILSHVCTQMSRVAERDRSEKLLMTRVTAELRKRDRALVEQNARFDAALKNMTQGLCMFGADKRLIVSNDRYAQMYNLPPEVMKPGISLRQILYHRIANGIFSGANPEEYVKERMAWVESGEVSSKVQHLSDGRSIAITHQPMPGGGWLTTHEDITDRVESERALQESQELFSKAFQLSPVALSISRPGDGSFHAVNDAWTKMFGYSRAEAMANTVLQLGIWKYPEHRKRFLEKLRTTGSMREFEVKQKTKSGQELDVLTYGEYVEVGGEELLFMVIHDITERKRAEEALRESELRYKTLVETTNVVPWEFDPVSMRFTYVGPQAAELFGYPIESWYEEDFWQNMIHPGDREAAANVCMSATRECKDHDFEYRALTADGRVLWVRDVVSVVAENGETKGLRGVLIDISDRIKANEALKSSERRFKDIVEISSDWIWECDENLRFTYLSQRFTQVTGMPKERVLGRTRHEFGKDAVADWDSHLADLEARRSFRAFSYAVKDESGDTRHWVISGRPVFDAEGTFTGYRGTGSDRTTEFRDQAELIRHRDHLQDLVDEATTELSERAEELRTALAKEKELNELQRQFVAMASHEFRTPLAIIDGAAQRLLRRAENLTPADTVRRVEKIRGAVGRMTQLMESTLDAARIEEGKINIEINECDLRYVVLEVAMHQIELSPGHNITCDLKELPDSIQGDKGALGQIFSNLLSNAVKYSPDTSDIHMRGWREGEFAAVEVGDQGLGIDEDDLPNMFQRFFRAKSSAGIAGTGIGLNLVKTLVELHDGKITVESSKGEGSLFKIFLPIDGPSTAGNSEHQAA